MTINQDDIANMHRVFELRAELARLPAKRVADLAAQAAKHRAELAAQAAKHRVELANFRRGA